MQLASEHFVPRLDGATKQCRLTRLDRGVGERVRPEFGGPRDAVCLSVEPPLRVGGDVDRLGVVDGLQVAPSEGANGRRAVLGDEENRGIAGGVVEADDSADVVAVECSHPAVW